MRVIQLEIENVKRIKAVSITPGEHLVEIAGNNEQGKSSVIDSIAFALGGQKLCPVKPIRDGELRASAAVTLNSEEYGDIKVERTWTAKGSSLTVTNAAGAKVARPQEILDKLVGSLTFDPLAWKRMEPAKQRAVLVDLLGLGDKLTTIDVGRTAAVKLRTDARAHVKRLDLEASQIVVAEGTPDDDVSVGNLMTQLDDARSVNAENSEKRGKLQSFQGNEVSAAKQVDLAAGDIKDHEDRISELRNQIKLAESAKLVASERWTAATESAKEAVKETRAYSKTLESLEDVDDQPIRESIANAETVNAAVRDRKLAKQTRKRAVQYQEQADKADGIVKNLDDDKIKMLADAKFPVDGMAFSADGVTVNGIPLEDGCSAAQQLRVSLAMGMAMNPDLRVLLVRDGSLLDDANLQVVREMVTKEGYQLWIERVGEGSGESAIVIEDGMVRGDGGADKDDPDPYDRREEVPE